MYIESSDLTFENALTKNQFKTQFFSPSKKNDLSLASKKDKHKTNMAATVPSMLTPVADKEDSCPKADLPLAPKANSDVCLENNAYLNFIEKKIKDEKGELGIKTVKIGLAVDKWFIDTLGWFSVTATEGAALVGAGVALTATYTTLMLTFPDISEKVDMYLVAAQKGSDEAQSKKDFNGFSIGYINYFMPSSLEKKNQSKRDNNQVQNSDNPLISWLANGIRSPAVNYSARAITLAAKISTTVIGSMKLVAQMIPAFEPQADEVEETTDEKIERYGEYADQISNVGKIITSRNKYYNDKLPSYMKRFGSLTPYAIFASLATFVVPQPVVGLIAGAASAVSWLATTTQVIDETKSKAAIDSLKFVIMKIHEVLKSSQIPPEKYSDIFARFIVGVSCPQYAVRDNDENLFTAVDKKQASILLYFWRYASYAYCIDPSTRTSLDFSECIEQNKTFSRRYYPIMDNQKGVTGFKNKLVNFFLVYDLTLGCYVASFQGTVSLDDILIDVIALPKEFQFTDKSAAKQEDSPTVNGYAHESMLQVASNCVNLMLQKLQKEYPFYARIPFIFAGHSLGAGVAAISALIFRNQGLQAYCLGIATPACVSPNLALAAKSFTVSLVNKSDIVPRFSECGLFNLTGSDRVCFNTKIKKLVTPGNVLWIREVNLLEEKEAKEDAHEIVQLKEKSEFSTSILARIDCFDTHGINSYFESLKSTDANANSDLIDFDFSFLFPNFPARKIEPEFIIRFLPENIAKSIEFCIKKNYAPKDERRQAIKAEKSEKDGSLEAEITKQCNKRIQIMQSDLLGQYDKLRKENETLKLEILKIKK